MTWNGQTQYKDLAANAKLMKYATPFWDMTHWRIKKITFDQIQRSAGNYNEAKASTCAELSFSHTSDHWKWPADFLKRSSLKMNRPVVIIILQAAKSCQNI